MKRWAQPLWGCWGGQRGRAAPSVHTRWDSPSLLSRARSSLSSSCPVFFSARKREVMRACTQCQQQRLREGLPHLVPTGNTPAPPDPCLGSPQPPGTFTDGAAQLLGVHLAGTVEGLTQNGVTDHCALLGAVGMELVTGGHS